jgi:hypothetical protein
LEQVIQSYEKDDHVHDMISKLMIDDKAVPGYTLKDRLLRYPNRIWIGSDLTLQQKIISAFHDSLVGGHSGMPVTYRKMKQYVAWKGMNSVVQEFVQNCLICQQAKPDRSKTLGLLQPLSVPDAAWQHISMDFVDGLPIVWCCNCILVVVDCFTKYNHFLALRHPYTAQSVAKLFLNQVYKLHGLPLSIVSDRDSIFTSQLWSALFELVGV